MEKPKPTIPAQARPLSLVARNPRSQKNSTQNLGYLVNPGNADERKEVEIASGNSEQAASRSEGGYSQANWQENALVESGNWWHEEQLQKRRDEKAYSNSNSARKFVQGATPNSEFQNMRYTNHQYMTKILRFFYKVAGDYWRKLNFLHGSIYNMCWHGECSCLRRWKSPVILDRIIWRIWISTRTRISRRLKVYSISLRRWYWNTVWKFISLLDEISIVSWSSGPKQLMEYEEEPHDDYTIPQKSPLSQSLETQSGCRSLDKIIQSTRSRIAILADEVICDHYP